MEKNFEDLSVNTRIRKYERGGAGTGGELEKLQIKTETVGEEAEVEGQLVRERGEQEEPCERAEANQKATYTYDPIKFEMKNRVIFHT